LFCAQKKTSVDKKRRKTALIFFNSTPYYIPALKGNILHIGKNPAPIDSEI